VILKTPAILTSYTPKVDGSMKLSFATQELTDLQKMDVLTYYQKFGWLLFKENEMMDEDVPEDDAVREGKTPQQRLRSVLYIYWKEKEIKESFNGWYERQIEKYIDSVKDKLDA
jgi:hypothetical protein